MTFYLLILSAANKFTTKDSKSYLEYLKLILLISNNVSESQNLTITKRRS